MLKMKYTRENIIKYYTIIKKLGLNAAQKARYVDCIENFDNAAKLAEKLNWIFKDDEIENCLLNLSNQLIIKNKSNYLPIQNRFIFYDHIGKKEVLSVQYYRALMSWNVHILYIIEPSQYTQPEYVDFLIKEFSNYPKVELLILPYDKRTLVKSIQNTYNIIRNYGAEKAFFHFPAEASHSIILWGSLTEIRRYRIVPGDHHYYLGVNITDYAIEFRNFGLSVSLQKRGFNRSKLLYQPYYPIIFNENNFEGFPQETAKKKIIIFAGGSIYKTFFNNSIFYTIVKYILDKYNNTILLYAGKGDFIATQKFIDDNNYSNRFLLLGFRKDLYRVMKNSDIYLYSTGGLMSQYAALCKKPIIALNPDGNKDCGGSIEGLLNYGTNGKRKIAFPTVDSLHKYIDKLINDVQFREKQGAELSTRIITPDNFNESLQLLIKSNELSIDIKHTPESCFEKKLNETIEQQNKYQKNIYRSLLIRAYKFRSIQFFPKIFIDAVYAKFYKLLSTHK